MAEITGRTSKGGLKTWLFRGSGLARVEAVTVSSEEDAAHKGMAYALHGVCHLAAATSGVLMYFKNTSALNTLHITRVHIDPQGAMTPTDLLVNFTLNPTTQTSGTDITSTGVVQKTTNKVNALKDAGITLKISDGSADATFTGGDQFEEFPITDVTSVLRNLDGAVDVGPGGEFIVGWASAGTATDAELVGVTVQVYVALTDPE